MTTNLTIVGVGYVGLTTAACLAELGHQVDAIDIDSDKIARLQQGALPLFEPGLYELVMRNTDAGRLRFSTDYGAASEAAMHLLCLPTPAGEGGEADLTALDEAVSALRAVARHGATVITKSTVPVGTHRRVIEQLNRDDISVVSNPEFLREGSAIDDFFHPDRIVVGADDPEVGGRVLDLYSRIDTRTHLVDPASAELIKYASNAFLAVKLSFVNEIARLSDRLGANIDQVTEALASDPRIGRRFLQPGPGWGGSCFPKDTRALARTGRDAGRNLAVVEASIDSNLAHQRWIVELIRSCADRPLQESRFAVWGATFKAGTDDLRESPALAVARLLSAAGAELQIFDPAADRSQVPYPVADDPYSACRDADGLIVLTEWPELAAADLTKVADLLRYPLVVDTRSIIDPARATEAGLLLRQPGRPDALLAVP